MTIKNIILIPIYNDWKSLNQLLLNIDKCFKNKNNNNIEVLVIDDRSNKKLLIENKKFFSITKIKVITLSENLGSQKAIAVGLTYLKKKEENSIITVMDGDGEDNPEELVKMILLASNNSEFVVTSNRKARKESPIIILLYKIHLIVTFIFTFKWISFGNFTSFHSSNLNKLLKGNSSWYAHSSSVLKNCEIKKTYSKREKRYFDKSNLGLYSLAEHSLRINSVFLRNIIFSSLMYVLFILIFIPKSFGLILTGLILVFNILVILTKLKHKPKKRIELNKIIEKEILF